MTPIGTPPFCMPSPLTTEGPPAAKKRSLLILKSADKTGQQLVEKLRGDEYPEEIVQKALAYVESYGYVDDLRYAKDYIESTGGSRSKKRIFSDLLRKGISADLIEKAFEEAGEPDEETQIRLLMEKRGFDPEAADRSERDKMVRYLLGKGYAYEQIRRGLERFHPMEKEAQNSQYPAKLDRAFDQLYEGRGREHELIEG